MSTSIAAADPSGIHPNIVQSHILTRLDGPTLAAASCASAALLSMCGSDDRLWRGICHSTTDPSVAAAISTFPSCHRSFFSDAFPSAAAPKLISAVDIHYGGALVYLKVFDETLSPWFLTTSIVPPRAPRSEGDRGASAAAGFGRKSIAVHKF